MKIMKKAVLAVVMAAVAITGFTVQPSAAQANTTWQPEVLVSSAQARFEAQPTAYDSASSKYKYKFSWLMPAKRIYSFKIDGRMYNPKVTANGVAETPFWFSPNITYTIQIFPYANGQGAMLAEGSFMAPSATPQTPIPPVVAPPAPTTLEQEGQIMAEYIINAPKISKKTVTSKMDVAGIAALLSDSSDVKNMSDLLKYSSAESNRMFAQIPLILKEIDAEYEKDLVYTNIKSEKVKIFTGKTYGSYSFKGKDPETGKFENVEIIFIKENGAWKIDWIQTYKLDL